MFKEKRFVYNEIPESTKEIPKPSVREEVANKEKTSITNEVNKSLTEEVEEEQKLSVEEADAIFDDLGSMVDRLRQSKKDEIFYEKDGNYYTIRLAAQRTSAGSRFNTNKLTIIKYNDETRQQARSTLLLKWRLYANDERYKEGEGGRITMKRVMSLIHDGKKIAEVEGEKFKFASAEEIQDDKRIIDTFGQIASDTNGTILADKAREYMEVVNEVLDEKTLPTQKDIEDVRSF